MSESLIAKIATGLRQVSTNMLAQSEARMEDTSVEAKGFLSEAMDQYADRINGYAAELEAHLAEPVEGTHVFDMIAAVELGNIETTETLIHMVAATVLAKLIEDEGGGRANISFSPADMDAMHRDYEMIANRDGMVTTIKLVPREAKLASHQHHDIVAGVAVETEASLMQQDEDTTDALPQVEASPAKPYFFYRDGGGRQGPMSKDDAQAKVFQSVDPTAHVENRMCGRVECPNSDMQGSCPACNAI